MDMRAYEDWFRSEGSRAGHALDADSWKKAKRDLVFIEASGLPLDSATPADARRFLVRKLDSGRVSHGRLNGLRTELLRWFRFRDGATPSLPRWREEDPKEKALTAPQKARAFTYVHRNPAIEMRGRFLVALALTSGAEPAEVAPMDVDDFDLDRGGVEIRHPSKGHARRFVPLPETFLTDPTKPSLAAWLQQREICPTDPKALLTGRQGTRRQARRLTPSALSGLLQKVRAQTGAPINWQATRHTTATDLLEAGLGERYVMHVLGLRSLAHLPRYAEARSVALVARFRALGGTDPYAHDSQEKVMCDGQVEQGRQDP